MKKVILSLDKHSNKQKEKTYYTELMAAYNNTLATGWLAEGGYTHRNGSQFIEPSLYFMNISDKQYEYLLELARKYEQESVLVVDQTNDKAFLVYLDKPNEPIYIGQWTQVNSTQIPDLEGFTRIADTFYAAV